MIPYFLQALPQTKLSQKLDQFMGDVASATFLFCEKIVPKSPTGLTKKRISSPLASQMSLLPIRKYKILAEKTQVSNFPHTNIATSQTENLHSMFFLLSKCGYPHLTTAPNARCIVSMRQARGTSSLIRTKKDRLPLWWCDLFGPPGKRLPHAKATYVEDGRVVQ